MRVLSFNRSRQTEAEISKLPSVSYGSDFGSFFKEFTVLIATLSHVYAIQSETFKMVKQELNFQSLCYTV